MHNQILNAYYADNLRKLHRTVDKICLKFGGLSNKDLDERKADRMAVSLDAPVKEEDGCILLELIEDGFNLEKIAADQGGSITETGLFYEKISAITALIMETQQMTSKQYGEFKAEFMAEVKSAYPLAARFINNVLIAMDMCLLKE